MNKRIIDFVDTVYKLLIASFYFWLYVIKNLIAYGFFPSMCTIMLVVNDIFENKDEIAIGQAFKEKFNDFKKYRIHSLFIVMYHSIILLCLYLLNKSNLTISKIATFIFLYLLLGGIVLITFVAYYIAFYQMPFKQALLNSFIESIKKIFVSISILAISLVSIWLSFKNLVAMIFVVPTMFAICIRTLLVNRKIG